MTTNTNTAAAGNVTSTVTLFYGQTSFILPGYTPDRVQSILKALADPNAVLNIPTTTGSTNIPVRAITSITVTRDGAR